MSNAYQLSVYKQSYALNRHVYMIVKKFPKDLKHSLGQRILNSCLELISKIVHANQVDIKKDLIFDAILQIEILYTYSRMSEDFKAITIGEFQVLSEHLAEISLQLKAWLNWDKKQNR
jgi:hypothetical protein